MDLNLAVYLPLLPISLAQARWDQYYDQQYQSRRTFLLRGVVGFVLTLLGTFQMLTSTSLTSLVLDALVQGTGGAILYGTLNQLASFITVPGGNDGRLKATVSAGVQSSALIVLAVSTVTGFGVKNGERFSVFLWTILAIECICFFMFLWLLVNRPSVAASMTRRDSSLRLEEGQSQPLDADAQEPLLAFDRQSSVIELSFDELWKFSKPCCLILIVTLVPSFLVGSWFTRVETDWMALAQVLFYVRIGADFLGRLATILVPPRSVTCLTWTATFRLFPVVLFFAHSRSSLFGYHSDIFSIGLVATIAFLSGYLVTGCFQLASNDLPLELRSTNLAKQASLLTVFFAVAAIGGLLSSFTLIFIGI